MDLSPKHSSTCPPPLARRLEAIPSRQRSGADDLPRRSRAPNWDMLGLAAWRPCPLDASPKTFQETFLLWLALCAAVSASSGGPRRRRPSDEVTEWWTGARTGGNR